MEASLPQTLGLNMGRHQRQPAAVVEIAQACGDETAEGAQMIIGGVLIEIGVKAADDGNRQVACRCQRRPAERPFGGDIDHVRARLAPEARQTWPIGSPHMDPCIARQGKSADLHVSLCTAIAATLLRSWPHQLQDDATGDEVLGQVPQRMGDTVDFGCPGFTDQCDSHDAPSVSYRDIARLVHRHDSHASLP